MTYAKDRNEFIDIMRSEGMDFFTAKRILRIATTMQRLAEASCNGDYPADNGKRKVKECPNCHSCYVPYSFIRGVCPSCRIDQRATEAMPTGFEAVLNGDPRGAVFKVKVPSGRTNDWGKEGICVPTKGY